MIKEIKILNHRAGKLIKVFYELINKSEKGEKVEFWSNRLVIVDRKSYEQLKSAKDRLG